MDFQKVLKDGDLRSIGKSDLVVSMVNDQKSFDELFVLLFGKDRKVVMRAADAIEKITIPHPEYLEKHKAAILELCSNANAKELKWHLALIVSRLKLTEDELGRIWQTLTGWATNQKESRIVRVNSLQGLYNLLAQNPDLRQDLLQTI